MPMKIDVGCGARTIVDHVPMQFAALLLCLLPFQFRAAERTNAPALPPDIHRIVFLGDSITYSGQYIEFIDS